MNIRVLLVKSPVIGCSHQFGFLTLREIRTENKKTKFENIHRYIYIHTHIYIYIYIYYIRYNRIYIYIYIYNRIYIYIYNRIYIYIYITIIY